MNVGSCQHVQELGHQMSPHTPAPLFCRFTRLDNNTCLALMMIYICMHTDAATQALNASTEIWCFGHAAGRLQDTCDEVGIGYRWEGAQLGALHDYMPSNGEVCEHFEMVVRHDPHQNGPFWLTDICQQGVDVVVNKNGKIMMAQSTSLAAQDKFTDIGSCL